jgi:hypothetical protein
MTEFEKYCWILAGLVMICLVYYALSGDAMTAEFGKSDDMAAEFAIGGGFIAGGN